MLDCQFWRRWVQSVEGSAAVSCSYSSPPSVQVEIHTKSVKKVQHKRHRNNNYKKKTTTLKQPWWSRTDSVGFLAESWKLISVSEKHRLSPSSFFSFTWVSTFYIKGTEWINQALSSIGKFLSQATELTRFYGKLGSYRRRVKPYVNISTCFHVSKDKHWW